ncbi:MAG: discoidin domain-containing protein [Tannerella sp.]|jgi:hypothetical protein|nr:discoidin domain-containing protein [Tannerella sp.]
MARFLFITLLLLNCLAIASKQNVALNRAVYQSSSIDYDRCGHLVTDGSERTFWESKVDAENWIAIDLGAITPVSKVKIIWGDNWGVVYKIQTATTNPNKAQWFDIHICTQGQGGIEEIILPAYTECYSMRILIMSVKEMRRGGGTVIIREVEIEGEKKVALPTRRQPYLKDDSKTLVLTDGNWKLQNEMFLMSSYDNISSSGFDDSDWIPAIVPGTILGSYLAIGALPDPYYGSQNEQISESFFSFNNFCYRNVFRMPDSFSPDDRLFLYFGGINWKSIIYLNGKLIGLIDGAFKRERFDVTGLIDRDRDNVLAVFIRKLDHAAPWPRKVLSKYIGAPTVNGDLIGYDSPTFMASGGWNWQPIIRGRNLGIWGIVSLEAGSEIEIKDPYIVNSLNLPDTTEATLTFRTDLRNYSNKTADCIVKINLLGQTHSQPVKLLPHETTAVKIDNIKISDPVLWWPNGYGNPVLHDVTVTVENASGNVRSKKSFKHGIRDLQSKIENGILWVYVNGYRMLIRGGNWGLPEAMLNCDETGFDLRVRLHRDANFNMIRNWVGQNTNPYFYEACDKYGLLVFDDFWLANAVDGPDPMDFNMFMSNAMDKIRNVRQHASLAFYCGRNESYPPVELDRAMRKAVEELDGSRHYASHSAADEFTGLGPYDIMPKEWYFANRGKTFHSEQGIIAFPTVESLRQMMPEEYWWPINNMWAIHDYQTPRSLLFTQTLMQRYGVPSNEEEYSLKAQMLNMESSKAIFECLQNNRGSGVLIWMSQSSWPSMICQLYDHYFEPTASFFGAKRACSPIHIFWNPLSDKLRVANNSLHPLHKLRAYVVICDIQGNILFSKEADIADIQANSAIDILDLPLRKDKLDLIKLKLKDGAQTIAENFYWSQDSNESCLELLQMPRVTLSFAIKRELVGNETRLYVTIKNTAKSPALNIRLGIRDTRGERVLPVFYSDNYFSLLSGESRNISISISADNASDMFVEGWNVGRTYQKIK